MNKNSVDLSAFIDNVIVIDSSCHGTWQDTAAVTHPNAIIYRPVKIECSRSCYI